MQLKKYTVLELEWSAVFDWEFSALRSITTQSGILRDTAWRFTQTRDTVRKCVTLVRGVMQLRDEVRSGTQFHVPRGVSRILPRKAHGT